MLKMAVGPFMTQRKIKEIINLLLYPLLKKFRPEEKYWLSEDMREHMFDMQRAAVFYSADKARRLAYLNQIKAEVAVMPGTQTVTISAKRSFPHIHIYRYTD